MKKSKNSVTKSKFKTRKELRKEKRQQKKLNRVHYFAKKTELRRERKLGMKGKKDSVGKPTDNDRKRKDSEREQDDRKEKSIKSKTGKKEKPTTMVEIERTQRQEKEEMKKMGREMRKQRVKQLNMAIEDEDKTIRQMEKLLKIDKSKSKKLIPRMFNDGLDYALELCLNSDDEAALKRDKKRAKDGRQSKFNESDVDNSDQEGLENDYDDDDNFSDIDSELENHSNESNDDESIQSDNEDDLEGRAEKKLKFTEPEDDDETSPGRDNTWEDIYGRKRNKDGSIVTPSDTESKNVYVPPHLRAAKTTTVDSKQQEKHNQLCRRLKGFLNRLAESNLLKISSSIERLYLENSRSEMGNALSSLIFDALIKNVLTNERMVLEYMFLISALHVNVGTEVGAYFLQKTIELFQEEFAETSSKPIENKRLNNIVQILCHMYTFKIFKHTLIYDMIHKLAERFDEKSIECILLALKSIGFSLRKDDPLALKNLVGVLQNKSNEISKVTEENSHIKYMLDILTAIKNNNMKKIPQYDPTLAEQLLKTFKTILTNGKYLTSLNISLQDLLQANQNGKWWIVGSAWTGNVGQGVSQTGNDTEKLKGDTFSQQLLELAKKQRMNTDDKRNIFCILMTAEDYIDAFERLLQLSIKDNRLIATVVIHCCLSEKQFNPYYAVLSQKLCDYDRKYQLAIQFAVWDRINDLQSHTATQQNNLATYLIHLIENSGQPISILKVIDFADIDKRMQSFLKQILCGLLLKQEEICKKVFERIARSTKLKSFKDSLRLFIHHFLLNNELKGKMKDDQYQLLKSRVQIADKSLNTIQNWM